jgi:hypothetical protein
VHALAAASVEIEYALLDVRRDAHGVGFEVDACLGHNLDRLEEVTLEPFGAAGIAHDRPRGSEEGKDKDKDEDEDVQVINEGNQRVRWCCSHGGWGHSWMCNCT